MLSLLNLFNVIANLRVEFLILPIIVHAVNNADDTGYGTDDRYDD